MSKPVNVSVIRRPVQIQYTGGPAVVTLPSTGSGGTPPPPPPPLPLDLERTTNKTADVWGDKDSPLKYTTAGAVYQARKELLIDMWNARGIDRFAPAGQQQYATYNRNTGYFEINGLTDVTYEQAVEIYGLTADGIDDLMQIYKFADSSIRTTFRRRYSLGNGQVWTNYAFANSALEVFDTGGGTYPNGVSLVGIFDGCLNMRTCQVISSRSLTGINDFAFRGCVALEVCRLNDLTKSISFAQSPLLNNSSIEYIVRNAGTPADIVITLHPTAYARAIADPAVQSILAIKPNVTLAM